MKAEIGRVRREAEQAAEPQVAIGRMMLQARHGNPVRIGEPGAFAPRPRQGFAHAAAVVHDMGLHRGAGAYEAGEETALLETLDGRPPFPRIAPPFRRGVDEVVESDADVDSESGLSAHVETAGASATQDAPPVRTTGTVGGIE